MTTRFATGLLLFFAASSAAPAQVVYPARPEKVDVQLRYRIKAARDERVRQFRELDKTLKSLGFEKKREPDDDLDILDPTAERFSGVIESKNVEKLLANPWVQTILFKPTDYQYPVDAATPVSLRIRIAGGYLPAEQQRFHRQVVEQLAKMGFREFVGYDHQGDTLVRGDLPAGYVPRLLKDLRSEPAGWFLPDTMPVELPSPLKDTLPIRWIEVLAGAELTLLPPAAVAPNRAIFTPDLRAILDDPAQAMKPVRVEVVMDRRLTADDLEVIRTRLRGQYSREIVNPATGLREQQGATLEGAVGNVATIHFQQAVDADRAQLEARVVGMRLPRSSVETVATAFGKETSRADVLAASKVAEFQKLGYKGQGTRIVVIASEFPGLGSAFGHRFLNPGHQTAVKFIDLTAETSADIMPAPRRSGAFAGTAAARAAYLAAPDAAFVLVRVDPASLYQVNAVARYIRGDGDYTEAMKSRVLELYQRKEELDRNYEAAAEEYRRAFADFSQEEAPRMRRARARQVLDVLIREVAVHAATISRATVLQRQMRELAGADVVLNTLVWEDGFELDGLSELAQTIESSFAGEAITSSNIRSATRPRPRPKALWVQAGSPSIGSVWAGSFLDRESNNSMDFADRDVKIPAGSWTRELNFFGTRAPDGKQVQTVAMGSKVRVTVQWREAHDQNSYVSRDSLFPLTLRVLQQLDPEGKVRASDEMKEIARSVGGPYQVYVDPTFGIYEQIIEFTAPSDGRYALRVEGATIYDSRLPALERHIEIQPRMFVEFVGAAPDKGRPVFASFAPTNAGIGIPGDAKAAVAVGPLSGGLTGGGPGLDLLVKPDLRADAAIDTRTKLNGTGVAAGFAAGTLAGLLSSGAPPMNILGATGLERGSVLAVPPNWLKVVPIRK